MRRGSLEGSPPESREEPFPPKGGRGHWGEIPGIGVSSPLSGVDSRFPTVLKEEQEAFSFIPTADSFVVVAYYNG
jgi:hypothetical protein